MAQPSRGRPRGATTPAGVLQMRGLRPSPKLLYGLLESYGHQSRVCYASVDTLATQMAVARRTIQRYLRSLVKAGLVVTQQHSGRPTHYSLPALSVVPTPANIGMTVLSPLPASELTYAPPQTVTLINHLPMGLSHTSDHTSSTLNSAGADVQGQTPAFAYEKLVLVLLPHARAIGKGDTVATDTDLLRKIVAAAGGYPELAAHIVGDIAWRRFMAPGPTRQPWPYSLAYWVPVVKSRMKEYLTRGRTK